MKRAFDLVMAGYMKIATDAEQGNPLEGSCGSCPSLHIKVSEEVRRPEDKGAIHRERIIGLGLAALIEDEPNFYPVEDYSEDSISPLLLEEVERG